MNPADKLEVAWIETDHHPRLVPRVRVEYSDDPESADSPRRCLEASLSGCDDPRCGCLDLRFEWRLAGVEPAAALSLPECAFWFDPDARLLRFATEQEKTPTTRRLAEILRAELTTADLQKLREWFLAWKLAVILRTPPAQIDIADLPIVVDGAMIGFAEVFPFGLTLNFTWNEVSWAVDDAYCVQTDCSCKETVLVFRKLDGPAGAPVTRFGNAPALRYNYQTQAAKWEFKAGAARPVLDGVAPGSQARATLIEWRAGTSPCLDAKPLPPASPGARERADATSGSESARPRAASRRPQRAVPVRQRPQVQALLLEQAPGLSQSEGFGENSRKSSGASPSECLAPAVTGAVQRPLDCAQRSPSASAGRRGFRRSRGRRRAPPADQSLCPL